MSSIKQVCLGVAVAGLVAGGGSAAAAGVAYADTSGPDSTSAADSAATESSGRSAKETSRSRTRTPKAAAAEPAAGGPSARSASPARRNNDDRRVPGRTRAAAPDPEPTAAIPQRTRDHGVVAGPVSADVAVPRASDAAAAVPAPAPVSAVERPAAVVAIAAPAAVAAPVPTVPAPAPVPLLPLPAAPALPVAPASAVTVGSAGTTSRRTSLAASSAQIGDTPTHVLLIGTDGTNLSKILEYTYDDPDSGFRRAMDEGVTGATTLVGNTTISGPSWSTILTGAWDNKTGVINNLFDPAPYTAWPTAINLIEFTKPAVNTAVFANWQYINDIADAGGFPADENVFVDFDTSWEDTDDLVVDATIDYINSIDGPESSFVFSYQVAVDEAGHLHGGASPEYAAAVINTSENIARILDAIDEWEQNNQGEEWTVIITTDHGHQASVGFGHGFQSPDETSAFVMIDLEGDDTDDGKQNLGFSNADITPTIVNLFGIEQRTDFDGVPLQDKATGIVDPVDLKQALSDAVGMYGYPDIGTALALGTRTIFASIPYFLDGFVTDITVQLQAITEQDIFLISALAGVTEFAVQVVGDVLVGVTQAVARVVATLTGSGTIPPTEDPLGTGAPSAEAQLVSATTVAAQSAITSANLLLNPGAEVGDPSLSGFSSVTIPGWTVSRGTPTVIGYGTPRNLWPTGTSFKMPDLPSFLSFPKAKTGPADGGAQFFGGGDVSTGVLSQTIDLSAASGAIDGGLVSYTLSGWFGGFLFDPSSASLQVNFLDGNKLYLGSAQIGPVGALDRWLQTGFRERETDGYLPEGTRSAQVVLTLEDRNPRFIGFRADYNNAYADSLSFTIGSDLVTPAALEPPASTVGELDHVFMVYMENKGYTDIVGSPKAPFLNSLINAYGSATAYHGLTHPSLPNYYSIVGGTDFGLTYNCGTPCIDAETTLVSNIEGANKTWAGYAQSMPAPGTLTPSGDYSPSQLPFFAFRSIANDPARAANVKPLEQMATDLANPDTAPNFAWFAANEEFNGEGPVDFPWGILKFAISQLEIGNPYNIPALDQFLSETVPVVLNSATWNDPTRKSALFVTFDEDNNNTSLGFGNQDNRVVMVVIPSPGAIAEGMRAGAFTASNYYNHYSLLRTIEESLGIDARLTDNDRYATPMNAFWDGAGTSGAGSVV